MLVHNRGNYTRIANDVKVIPGANTLTEDEFAAFVQHPIVEWLIDNGEIIIPEGQAEDNATSLKELNADDAIKLVKDTFSIEFLEQFKVDEDRKTVLAAIDAQIAEIQGK
ncbi:hypothetical protein [Metasolibacillus sp.]|uniref:hypothetical protein n=1 Tax=Metasolibacillus sp. TaxID=2703680 RepID=UPI0025EDC0BE|nr:hypothetical protein [Metasolibacillus sp.]MCT6926160.1 hypothetical protein [Metasolibacillus sp.]MCT6942407.1 hypothetical protein [Metasolibacillus sp.]